MMDSGALLSRRFHLHILACSYVPAHKAVCVDAECFVVVVVVGLHSIV